MGTSHIAHMWRVDSDKRTKAKYHWNHKVTDNLARVAAAWFDEFAGSFHGGIDKRINVSEMLQVRQRLQCKPFVYFLHRFRKVYLDAAVIPPMVFRISARGIGKCIYRGGFNFMLGPCRTASWFNLANLRPDWFPSDGQFSVADSNSKPSLKSSPNTVKCGSHFAGSCAECPQGHGASWCNADCEWTFGGCAPKAKLLLRKPSASHRKCCSGIRHYGTMFCFDRLDATGPLPYQCDTMGVNSNQQFVFHSNGIIRHSSGLCLVATPDNKLAASDCSLPNITRWDKLEEYQPPEFKQYKDGVRRHGLTDDLPDH